MNLDKNKIKWKMENEKKTLSAENYKKTYCW